MNRQTEPVTMLSAAWGFTPDLAAPFVASGVGQVARWTHRSHEVADSTLPCHILAMKRSAGNAWLRRGGREIDARLRPGELGLLTEGSYGSWRFEFGDRLRQDVLHVYLPSARMKQLAAADDCRAGEPQESLRLKDPLLQMLMREVDSALEGNCASTLYMESLLAAICARLLHRHCAGARPTVMRGGLASWQLKRACEAMHSQLDQELSLDALAEIAGCSPTHFSRAFKQSMGIAPFHWLAERRIERAKELLEDGKLPLAEIALACGFSGQSQFTTAFGRATGVTPGAWRRHRIE